MKNFIEKLLENVYILVITLVIMVIGISVYVVVKKEYSEDESEEQWEEKMVEIDNKWKVYNDKFDKYLETLQLDTYVIGDNIEGLDDVVFSGYKLDTEQLILNDNGIPLYYSLSSKKINLEKDNTWYYFGGSYILKNKELSIFNKEEDLENGILRISIK